MQSLRGINTRGPGGQLAPGLGGMDGSSLPATPMTAGGGDIFDGLVTPTATAAAAAADAAGAAAAFQRPDSVPPLNTAALAAAGAAGSAVAPTTGATGTTFYSAQDAASGAFPSDRSAFKSTRSGLPSGRASDVFDFVQTPAHSSRGGTVAAGVAAGAVTAGVVAAAAAAAKLGSSEQQGASQQDEPAAVEVAAKRPGFRMDVNDLAEDSVSGEAGCLGLKEVACRLQRAFHCCVLNKIALCAQYLM